MNSSTSEDFNYLNSNNAKINIKDNMENLNEQNNGQPIKKNLTTDTDFHLQYLANPSKITLDLNNNNNDNSLSEESQLLDDLNNGSSETSIVIDEDDDHQ